jgi:hypothetical protein
MKTTINCEIDTKINTKEKPVKDSIEEIDRMKSSVESITKTLQVANTISKAELFVQLKIGKSILQEHKTKMEELSRAADDTRILTLVPSKDIQKFITSDDVAFGQIAETIVVKSIKHVADFNLKATSDKVPSYIHDACVTSRGEVIVVDYTNKRIKKLDHSYAVTEHVDVPGDNPEYICEVDSTEVAVTLHYSKKIQFILHQPLRLGRFFTAHAVCRGIDCYNKQLYICCGGYAQDEEGLPHIAVYSLAGILLRSYYEGLKLPLYIKVSDVSFLSEFGQKKIRTADSFDFHLQEMKFSSIDVPKGICWLGDDQLCVAGHISNNIVLISKDGNDERELLTEKDGIAKPLAVCFDKERSHLIVPLGGTDVIKVFKVNI